MRPTTLALLACAACASRNAGQPNPGVGSPDLGSNLDLSSNGAGNDLAASSSHHGIPFPAGSPWLSFYGPASMAGDLSMVAQRFRLINIDADPDQHNFTMAQIAQLKAGGQNRVVSYINIGACENFRSYWANVPAPYVSCSANQAAQLSTYQGYPNEVWMNVANADYQRLIVEYVAARLVGMGVDGFFLDNMEVVENNFTLGAVNGNPMTPRPCNATCSQGGLDLVARLRAAYPDMIIIMQNGTSDVTRLGSTGGATFPSLLDGLSHEQVFGQGGDAVAIAELAKWKSMNLSVNGNPFWIATEDYGTSGPGACPSASVAQPIFMQSKAAGYSPYVTDDSAGQQIVCYWSF